MKLSIIQPSGYSHFKNINANDIKMSVSRFDKTITWTIHNKELFQKYSSNQPLTIHFSFCI